MIVNGIQVWDATAKHRLAAHTYIEMGEGYKSLDNLTFYFVPPAIHQKTLCHFMTRRELHITAGPALTTTMFRSSRKLDAYLYNFIYIKTQCRLCIWTCRLLMIQNLFSKFSISDYIYIYIYDEQCIVKLLWLFLGALQLFVKHK